MVVYGNPVKRSPQSTIVDISHQPAAPYPVMEPSGLSVTIDTAPEYPDYNHELVIPHPIMDPGSEVSITVDTAPDYELHPVVVEDVMYKRQAPDVVPVSSLEPTVPMNHPHVKPPVVFVKRQADPLDAGAPSATAHFAL